MSSNQTHRPTFWCHDCDMSVHLLPSAVSSAPLCPLCHSQNLELMDDPSPTPSTDTTATSFLDSPSFRRFFLPFFGDFSPSDDSDSDSLSLFDSILPTIKISSALLGDEPESELICAICKEEFVVDVEAKLLPCDHLFHPECILPWLDSDHNSCPLCRFEIPSGSKLGDVCCSESSSNFALGDSIVGDEVDCGFPDVGVLSSFLPSHF